MARRIELVTTSFPGRPAFDTAASRALLQLVAEGQAPETLRLYQPDDVLAFSALDTVRPGFGAAVRAARERGFEPIMRLAGGRAAVFHRETLAFAWSLPAADPRVGIPERFEMLAGLVAAALRRLGVDARVGEVPGEYCPGTHSVNAGGRRKLMGVGQRVIRGAAHVGGVVVVRDAQRVREALTPVYQALGYAWSPDTAGAIEDEVAGVSRDDVARALIVELRAAHEVVERTAGAAPWLSRASAFEPRHRIDERVEPAGAGGGR